MGSGIGWLRALHSLNVAGGNNVRKEKDLIFVCELILEWLNKPECHTSEGVAQIQCLLKEALDAYSSEPDRLYQ